MCLLMPFMSELRGRREVSQELVTRLMETPSDERIPVRVVMGWLASGIAVTGDPDLGLKALHHLARGTFDVVEFAARSSSTWGESLKLMLRYIRILNEAAAFLAAGARLECHVGDAL